MGGGNRRKSEREIKRESETEEEGERSGRRKVNIYAYIDVRRVYV